MDENVLWIWLSLACTPGTDTFSKLITKFHSAREIYSKEDYEIYSVLDHKCSDRERLVDKSLDKAEKIYWFCKRNNVGITKYSDDDFPSLLRSISTPPVLLYYRGTLPDFDSCCPIAVVGTRWLTLYGRKNAYNISYDLAKAGALIVSGMARGIDGVSHAGAIAAGAKTVAVLGSGINICYPKQHLTLAKEIVNNGCVITEYPPYSKPYKHHFPIRNRIISGLSKALLLIEGDEKSGALISARCAKEQGRRVYALPGNVDSPTSQSSNLIIKNGAGLVTSADDIVSDMQDISGAMLNPFKLTLDKRTDMMSVLRELRVSALAVNDDVFVPSRQAWARKKEKKPDTVIKKVEKEPIQEEDESNNSFDALTLKIYKRIPKNEICSFESLVGDGVTLRDVNMAMLKLEIGQFVTIHPSERVSRKFRFK